MSHTKGNWKEGKESGTVVSDKIPENHEGKTGHEDVDYYGGFLIAESIRRKDDVKLIASAPDLLEACQIAIGDIERGPSKFSREEKIRIINAAIEKATK